MSENSSAIVSKVWGMCGPLRDVLADDIIENLQSALESFENLKEQLK